MIILILSISLRIVASVIIPFTSGPDFYGHAKYVFDLVNGKVPRVEWYYQNEKGYYDTRYHPPLFYSIAAVFYLLTDSFQISKMTALIFSILNLLVIFKTAKLIFPENSAFQFFTVSFASILPFDIMASTYLNNDSTVAFFSSLSLFYIISSKGSLVKLGILSGLSFLSKFNGIFVLFPLLFQEVRTHGFKVKRVLIVISIFLAISAWWYVRNFLLYGTPFPIWTFKEPQTLTFPDIFSISKNSIWSRLYATSFQNFVELEYFAVFVQMIGYVMMIFLMLVGIITAYKSGNNRLRILIIYALLFFAFFLFSSFTVFNKGIFVGRLLTPLVLPLSIFFGYEASKKYALTTFLVLIFVLAGILIHQVLDYSFFIMAAYPDFAAKAGLLQR